MRLPHVAVKSPTGVFAGKEVTDRRPFSECKKYTSNRIIFYKVLRLILFLSHTVAVMICVHVIRELVFDHVV